MPDADPGLLTIFSEALEQDASARAAYLDSTCGSNAELRRRVEALLAAHAGAGRFLEPQPQSSASNRSTGVFVPDADAYVETATGTGQERLSFASTADLGSVIAGRYKLVEVIGEGGMGTVYRTEQSQPIKRHVALKLIKTGMDSKSVLARFDAERQALALMDHPSRSKDCVPRSAEMVCDPLRRPRA